MDIGTPFPINENGYYLQVFPGSAIPESVVNAIKTDVSAFSSDVWYGFDTYFGKKDGIPFSGQFINSNHKEGLIHYVAFLSKLYAGQISFSLSPFKLPETFEHNRNI